VSNQLIELKDYEGRCNVLIPTVTMTQISPYHRIRVEQVKIDPDPEAGDVFKVGAKKVGNNWQDVLSLSKTAILKLGTAAGIVWNWNETKVLSVSKDYVLYQAVGAMRKPSGEWIPLKATKEIDLEVIEAETYEANLEKANKMKPEYRDKMSPEDWAAAKTKSNMLVAQEQADAGRNWRHAAGGAGPSFGKTSVFGCGAQEAVCGPDR